MPTIVVPLFRWLLRCSIILLLRRITLRWVALLWVRLLLIIMRLRWWRAITHLGALAVTMCQYPEDALEHCNRRVSGVHTCTAVRSGSILGPTLWRLV
jgi:hypothetical protein